MLPNIAGQIEEANINMSATKQRRTRKRKAPALDMQIDDCDPEEHMSWQSHQPKPGKIICSFSDFEGTELIHVREDEDSLNEAEVTCAQTPAAEGQTLPRNPRPSLCVCGEVYYNDDDASCELCTMSASTKLFC